MSLKANSLKSNEGQKRAIMKEVGTILASIDDEINISRERRDPRHSIGIRVPITFDIPYMSNKDAQRSIYYKILTSLLERDFIVKIQLEDNESIFHVTWLSEDDEKEIELQNALIAKHTIKSRPKQTAKTT